MEFPGFLGNAPVKEALSRAFSAGRFPHALLLQGEPGTGKGALCPAGGPGPCLPPQGPRPLRGVPLLRAGQGRLTSRYPRGGRERGDPLPYC